MIVSPVESEQSIKANKVLTNKTGFNNRIQNNEVKITKLAELAKCPKIKRLVDISSEEASQDKENQQVRIHERIRTINC